MAVYAYRAIDRDARVLVGRLQALDEPELERTLGQRGLTLIEASRSGFSLPGNWFGPRFNERDLRDFTYLLRIVLTSGLPLLSGLQEMTSTQDNPRQALAARHLQSEIESGVSLSDAMQVRGEFFPGYYVQMIRAGEISGTLEKSLDYLLAYLDWQIEFNRTVRSFMIYPAVLATIMSALVVILFTFVFPGLVKVLVGLKVDLPLPTRMVIGISEAVRTWFWYGLAGGVATFAALRFWLQGYQGRRQFDGWMLGLPVVGELLRKINLSRYFKTLATLNAAGLDVERSFNTAAEVVGNLVLRERLAGVTRTILGGGTIFQGMQASGVVPGLVLSMVAMGERTGQLEASLFRAGEIFDREVPVTLKRVFALVEPLLIVVLGAITLVILLSVFLPIYKITGGIHVR